jgi:hypothetical protein
MNFYCLLLYAILVFLLCTERIILSFHTFFIMSKLFMLGAFFTLGPLNF